ncbi:hypothetical protein L6452_36401 [Arctium lappa]|uniref:Uncharacterized protein n=1 Tax=Arctium lappa TaxID=4217 RepID=A0ACB8Y9Z8_ARCLA|nr:hypothetical protein L6452_36401 [Arctium lappa]
MLISRAKNGTRKTATFCIPTLENIDTYNDNIQDSASAIRDGWMGLDIELDFVKTFNDALETTKTVIWNGPMGALAKKLAELSGKLLEGKTLPGVDALHEAVTIHVLVSAYNPDLYATSKNRSKNRLVSISIMFSSDLVLLIGVAFDGFGAVAVAFLFNLVAAIVLMLSNDDCGASDNRGRERKGGRRDFDTNRKPNYQNHDEYRPRNRASSKVNKVDHRKSKSSLSIVGFRLCGFVPVNCSLAGDLGLVARERLDRTCFGFGAETVRRREGIEGVQKIEIGNGGE